MVRFLYTVHPSYITMVLPFYALLARRGQWLDKTQVGTYTGTLSTSALPSNQYY